MSDNPLDKIPAHNRISIRAVLVHEGEDAGAALAEAGFAETISIPVVLGEHPDLSGGILGNGITPNVMAVLETDPDDAADPSRNVRPGVAQPEPGDVGRPGPVTTMLPAAFGTQPLAPVLRGAQRLGPPPPNPFVVQGAGSSSSGSIRAAADDESPEPIKTAPTVTFGGSPRVPSLLADASEQIAGSSDTSP